MRDECISCATRIRLIDLDWQLLTQTTGANVHRVANARTSTVGALSCIQVGMGTCEKCKRYLELARAIMDRKDPE